MSDSQVSPPSYKLETSFPFLAASYFDPIEVIPLVSLLDGTYPIMHGHNSGPLSIQ